MTVTVLSAIRGISRWHYLLLVLLTLGLFFGPISNLHAALDVSAPTHHQHDHPSDDGNDGPLPAEPSDHDHPAMHCGAFSCAPSFSGALTSANPTVARRVLHSRYTIDDPMLRSLYLDSDPPVPRA